MDKSGTIFKIRAQIWHFFAIDKAGRARLGCALVARIMNQAGIGTEILCA